MLARDNSAELHFEFQIFFAPPRFFTGTARFANHVTFASVIMKT